MLLQTLEGHKAAVNGVAMLLHASLVMMDRETDSHWSILSEAAIWGPAQGTQLEQLPGAVKITWGRVEAISPPDPCDVHR